MDDLHLLLIRLTLMAKLEDDVAKKMVFEESAKALQTLLDENQSLWDMLDEMKASDIALHNEKFEDAITTVSSLLGSNGRGDA